MNPSDENKNREKIDRWLDAALERYSHFDEAEPRLGLEARVLATLEADRREREQNRYGWPWRLVLAAGVAVLLIVAIAKAPWRSTGQPASKPRETMGATARTQAKPQTPVVVTVKSNWTSNISSTRRNTPFAGFVSQAPAPRLAQFPAPRPLSEQERLLVVLVDNTSPEQLADDAALQQRLRREIEEARMSGGGTLEPRGK